MQMMFPPIKTVENAIKRKPKLLREPVLRVYAGVRRASS